MRNLSATMRHACPIWLTVVMLFQALWYCPFAMGQTTRSNPPTSMQKVRSALNAAKGPQTSPTAPEILMLQFLGNVEGTSNERRFYLSCLNRIVTAKDKAALPTIADVLNRVTQGHRSWNIAPNPMIDTMRKDLSEAWYELAWDKASDKEKIQTAFYGMRPDSPVRIDPVVSSTRIKELGEKSRAMFQIILHDPQLTVELTPWAVNMISCASQILTQSPFTMTEKQRQVILKEGGEYGRLVVLEYMSAIAHDQFAVPVLLDMIANSVKVKNPHKATYLTMLIAAYPTLDAAHVRQMDETLTAAGRLLQSRITPQTLTVAQVFFLMQVNYLLKKFGPTDSGKQYLGQYLKFNQAFDWSAVQKRLSDVWWSDVQRKAGGAAMYAKQALGQQAQHGH